MQFTTPKEENYFGEKKYSLPIHISVHIPPHPPLLTGLPFFFYRYLINSVKMGRGYFHTLHKETLERKNALMLEEQKEKRRLRTEFQPPRYQPPLSSSEEDSSDEEITE